MRCTVVMECWRMQAACMQCLRQQTRTQVEKFHAATPKPGRNLECAPFGRGSATKPHKNDAV